MSTIKKGGLTKQFNYYQKGERATTLVASETFGKNNLTAEKLSYTYDKKGNISEIRQNGELVARYEYDSLNRLVREDNRPLNKSYFITYDTAGNIVEKKESAFTLGLADTVTKHTVGSYIYGDNAYKKPVGTNNISIKGKLLSFNDESIEYDKLGNPTIYRDYNLTWSHVNRLASFGNVNFQYNYAGTRLFKTVGAKKTKYYCDGSKVIAQDDGTDMLYFYYGTEGVTAFKHKNAVYHYKKDMLGNILGIYDGNGQLLVKYVYDAWGNHKTFALQNGIWVDISGRTAYTTSDNIAIKIAILNPFRYRSYYFDIETGLYYLQTRYYDPETGRFISMDSIEYLDPDSIHGLNLYAYCGNNPIMCIDPSGKAFITALVLGILFGAAIGGTLNGISAYNDGQRGWGLFGSIVGGAIMGGAMGAIMVIGGTAGLTSLGIGFTEISLTFNTALGFSLALGLSAGFASYSVENLLRTDREWTITGFLASGASGVVKAAATFGIAYLGGRAGAFDKMVLKPLIKGAETISKGVTHGIAKSMMAELTHIFSRQLLTPFSIIFGDTTTKLLFVSLPAATVRYVIDFIFGT